jgi:hypothetical protein
MGAGLIVKGDQETFCLRTPFFCFLATFREELEGNSDTVLHRAHLRLTVKAIGLQLLLCHGEFLLEGTATFIRDTLSVKEASLKRRGNLFCGNNLVQRGIKGLLHGRKLGIGTIEILGEFAIDALEMLILLLELFLFATHSRDYFIDGILFLLHGNIMLLESRIFTLQSLIRTAIVVRLLRALCLELEVVGIHGFTDFLIEVQFALEFTHVHHLNIRVRDDIGCESLRDEFTGVGVHLSAPVEDI